jgi:hypothetical protein
LSARFLEVPAPRIRPKSKSGRIYDVSAVLEAFIRVGLAISWREAYNKI